MDLFFVDFMCYRNSSVSYWKYVCWNDICF